MRRQVTDAEAPPVTQLSTIAIASAPNIEMTKPSRDGRLDSVDILAASPPARWRCGWPIPGWPLSSCEATMM